MKTKLILPIAFLFLIGSGSCKKKDAHEEPGTSIGTTTGGGGPTAPPSDFSKCVGEIYFQEYITVGAGPSGDLKFPIEGRFYTLPITDSQKDDLHVGTITVNGIVLKRSGGTTTHQVYGDSTGQLISLPAFTLNASGTSSTPKIDFQYGGGSPVFGDTSSIPSVVKRSEGINLILKNISSADSVIFSIEKDHFEGVKKQILTFGKTEAKIEISGQDIGTMMGSNVEGYIRVMVIKKALCRAGGKDYLVRSMKMYSKKIMVSFF